jgi:putative hemolysin
MSEFEDAGHLDSYPTFRALLPTATVEGRHYTLRFAQSAADLDAVLALRYEVFNLELGEGLESSHAVERDIDPFDAQCHHLMVIERSVGRTVGTYRVQTAEMAEAGLGFYSNTIFDLGNIPDAILRVAVETGRACITGAHRNGRVLFLLWQGLARYMKHTGRRYIFGCSSLTSQDPEAGLSLRDRLRRNEQMHPSIHVPPRPGFECEIEEPIIRLAPEPEIPQLMQLYLSYGARICGGPALDREFKTIDFLTLLDVEDFDPRTRKRLLGR